MKSCIRCKEIKELDGFGKLKASKDGRTAKCKACYSARKRERYSESEDLREAQKQRNAIARNSDPDGHIRRNREWQSRNRRYACDYSAKWRKDNPDRRSEQQAHRRVLTKFAIPSMPPLEAELNQLVVREAYRLARLRTLMTCTEWHVDHIVPLKSESVCGFHCYRNLAVIPAKDNVMKSNRYWEGM